MHKLLIVCLLLFATISAAQNSASDHFRVMQYNVENLFDTIHDEGKEDYEFMPSSERRWTSPRYHRKLRRISKMIAAASGFTPIELIALCEVENDSVVNDLTQLYPLRAMGYEYVMTRCADVRGIDVALLYQPLRFKLLSTSVLHVPHKADERPTRDILCVAGLLPTLDTLHVLVCHFPSKAGGVRETHEYRMRAAHTARQYMDSLRLLDGKHNVILLGDLNDSPYSTIISEVVKAEPADTSDDAIFNTQKLYLLSHSKKAGDNGNIKGTYKYQNRWEQIDHMIVSGNMLHQADVSHNSCSTRWSACQIFAPAFALKHDDIDGGAKPYRTYQGPIYKDGFSDHLPLVLTLTLKWE